MTAKVYANVLTQQQLRRQKLHQRFIWLSEMLVVDAYLLFVHVICFNFVSFNTAAHVCKKFYFHCRTRQAILVSK